MNIKIWCEKCKGAKTVTTAITAGRGIIACDTKPCPECGGKGYAEHEGSLEDLECAEINNELVENGFCVRYFKSIKFNVYKIDLYEPSLQLGFLFEGGTPLKVYRKAKEWVEEVLNE